MKILMLFLLSINWVLAQPGGGGGLKIKNVFDENLNHIDVNDTNMPIRILVLDSLMNVIETRAFVPHYKHGLYLPPSGRRNTMYRTYGIEIEYEHKKYRIDFENIMPQNGGGYVAEMDSLVLFKPYILSKRNYTHPSHDGNEFQKYSLLIDLALPDLQAGITPLTFKKLSAIDLLFEDPEYSYNRHPKPWMAAFKNLYGDYGESNFTHSTSETEEMLKKLDMLIEQYTLLQPFQVLKIRLLNDLGKYNDIVECYEGQPFTYSQKKLSYPISILIQAYEKTGNYAAARTVAKEAAEAMRETDGFLYFSFMEKYFFIKVYLERENIGQELQRFLATNEDWRNQAWITIKLKCLIAFNRYQFEDKQQGLEMIEKLDRRHIRTEILEAMAY